MKLRGSGLAITWGLVGGEIQAKSKDMTEEFRHTLVVTITMATEAEDKHFQMDPLYSICKKIYETGGDEIRKNSQIYQKWRLWYILKKDRGSLQSNINIRNPGKETGRYNVFSGYDGEGVEIRKEVDKLDPSWNHDDSFEIRESTVSTDSVMLCKDSKQSDNIRGKFEKMRPGDGKRTRLMIFGHGATSSRAIAGMDPRRLAEFLCAHGLPTDIGEGFKVSLIACCAAQDLQKSRSISDNFAHNFHRLLKENHGICAELTARTGLTSLMLAAPFSKMVQNAEDPTSDSNGWVKQRPATKYRWVWVGDKQIIFDAYANMLVGASDKDGTFVTRTVKLPAH